jgi:hypothetical protein
MRNEVPEDAEVRRVLAFVFAQDSLETLAQCEPSLIRRLGP